MKLHANVCSQWEWTKLRQLLVIVLLGLGIVSTYGQTKTVSGIVKSESGGEPLVGATVKVKETNQYKYNQNADQHNLNPAACFRLAIVK